tara:strand:- start:2685 stop:2981 length:297 start_codon:yes stop_codon:yes gene_type:complete
MTSNKNKGKSKFKLDKLRELKIKKLEKILIDVTLRGEEHYVFFNERNKAQIVSNTKAWISEHIRTSILKHNYQVDKVSQMLIRDFTDKELQEFDKRYN